MVRSDRGLRVETIGIGFVTFGSPPPPEASSGTAKVNFLATELNGDLASVLRNERVNVRLPFLKSLSWAHLSPEPIHSLLTHS